MNRTTCTAECLCGMHEACVCENACACECHFNEERQADFNATDWGDEEYDDDER